MKALDLTGKTFGRLTVLGRAGKLGNDNAWKCSCSCSPGKEVVVRASNLNRGDTVSCGCLKRERTITRNTTHGLAFSPGYNSWRGMKSRCENPRNARYADYGDRGITVCDRWKNSFENFIADMGPPPSPAHSIERGDNSRGYEPGNCRWATDVEQTNNQRSNVLIEYDGKTQTIAQWARELEINYQTLRQRIQRYGWSVERAFSSQAS